MRATRSRDPEARASEIPREKQHDDDDQDDADETVAAMTVAVARAPETAAETAKQEDDEDETRIVPSDMRSPLQDLRAEPLGGSPRLYR
jgi:hypothetical protein